MPEQREVRIVQLDTETLAALAAGDIVAARQRSGLPLTDYFVAPDNLGVWQRRARQVVEDPSSQPWITGAVLDLSNGLPVGRAGYHGPPDERGMVEIGYSIDPEYRRRGYARAVVRALIERARQESDVRVVRASIAPDNLASHRVIAGFGFVEVGAVLDDEDGWEQVFELPLAVPAARAQSASSS